MTPQERYTLIQETMQAFNPHYTEVVQQVFTETGMQGVDWFFCYLAFGLEPEPLTADVLHQMTPYGNRKNQVERLAQTGERGYLNSDDQINYFLNESGRAAVEQFFNNATTAISPLRPLSAEKMARLANFLGRIITATEAANPPALKTHFSICRRTDPGADAVPASKIDQYLTDLLRYRDDAHLAAWVDLGVNGRTWDTFSHVWRNENSTTTTIAEALSNRNYEEADYAASLNKLVERGWIEAQNDTYTITENGRKLREEAEATTDRYYYIGWTALSDEETSELDTLLAELRDSLQTLAADKAVSIHKEATATLTGKISGAIYKLTRPVMDPLMAELELNERGLPFGLLQTLAFDPTPISGTLVTTRFPYATAASWDETLRKLADKGLLSATADDAYTLTENGRTTVNQILDAFRDHLATITTDVDLDKTAELLGRVVTACSNTTAPAPNAIRQSRNIAPADDASALAKIDQHLDDLNAYRDDAHIATFAPHKISGHGWELFTMLWRGDVTNAAEMAEKMAFRGHDEAAYAAALDDLVYRDWIMPQNGGYVLTKLGKEVREAAELQTDRYFYRPWLVLNQADADELHKLLAETNSQLTQLSEAVAEPV